MTKYNPYSTYTSDLYKKEKDKNTLIKKDIDILYYEEKDKWITWDNYLKYCAEPLLGNKKLTKEELNQIKQKREESLIPYKNIKEGEIYIDIKALKERITPINDPDLLYDKVIGPSWRKKR